MYHVQIKVVALLTPVIMPQIKVVDSCALQICHALEQTFEILHCSDHLSCLRADLLMSLVCSDLGKKHGRLPLSSTSKWLRILHTDLPLDGPPQGLLLEFYLLF